MAPATKDSAEFRVVNLGASYKLPGQTEGARFAVKGEVISLDADEATRLRELGAVVGKDEPDPVPSVLVGGNPDNPVGGIPLESQDAHAAKVEAAQAAAPAPVAAPADGTPAA
jgi:hypothetical protein